MNIRNFRQIFLLILTLFRMLKIAVRVILKMRNSSTSFPGLFPFFPSRREDGTPVLPSGWEKREKPWERGWEQLCHSRPPMSRTMKIRKLKLFYFQKNARYRAKELCRNIFLGNLSLNEGKISVGLPVLILDIW